MSIWRKFHNLFTSEKVIEDNNSTTLPQRQASATLSQLIEHLTSFLELQSTLEAFKEQLYRPLEVAIVGEYNAGKSTFLNAVLQDTILPTGQLPTTGCVNYIRYGKFSIVAHYKDGSSESLDPEMFREISTHNYDDPNQTYQLQQLKYVEVFKPIKILEQIVFIDTPGLNAPTEADRKITEELLSKSDAIIWLTSAQQVLAATEVETLEAFGERYSGKSLCVISQIDILNQPKREVPILLTYAQKTLSDYFSDIVAISALEATNGQTGRLQPFYDSFWQRIVPRSREIVAQSILLDAKNLIVDFINDFENEKKRWTKLGNDLSELQQNAQQVTTKMLLETREATKTSSRNFHDLQNSLITRIQQECTTRTDYEPYTKINEGIFWNDSEVAYKMVEYWIWPDEAVNQAHEWISGETEGILNKFIEHCQETSQNIAEKLEKTNLSFLGDNQDILNEASLKTSAQSSMIVSQYGSYLDSLHSYFWGAMNHGGVYPISWVLFYNESTSRPTATRVSELVKGLLPFEALKTILNEHQNFEEAVQIAVTSCYDWLESDISTQLQHYSELIKELENAQKLIVF